MSKRIDKSRLDDLIDERNEEGSRFTSVNEEMI